MSSSYRKASGVRALARFALPAVGGATLLLGSSIASAQAWIWDPRIELQAIYNDNNRLSNVPGQEIETTGGGIDALVTARKQGQASLFEITPHIHSTYFPDESSEESTDYYLDLKADKRTQRTTSAIVAQFADESVVTSDLLLADFPGVDLGQTVSGDSGRVSVRNRRRLYSLMPSFDFDWTERRHLTFDAHYINAAYDDTLFEQIGYTDYGASAGIRWDLSRRSSFSVNVVGAQFSPDDDSPDTTITGLVAEWRTAPSAVTNFYFRVGGNRSERDANGVNPSLSTSNFNGGVGVAWNFQVTRILIDALRSTSPSSQGTVVDRDELRFSITRDFSPRVVGFVGLRGIRTQGLSESGTDVSERKYYTGRTGFEWRMTRQFSLESAYEYKWQEYEGDAESASSNGVTLSLVYQPRRLN